MVVGVARIALRIPENHSLKGKRRVINGIIGKIRSRFDVAISEVGLHDSWQGSELGITTVGNSQPVLDAVFAKILDFIDATFPVEVVSSDVEFIHMGR